MEQELALVSLRKNNSGEDMPVSPLQELSPNLTRSLRSGKIGLKRVANKEDDHIRVLLDKANENEARFLRMEKFMAALSLENDKVNSQLSSLQQENDKVNHQLSSLQQENEKVNHQLSSLQQENEKVNHQLSSLQQENDKVNHQLSSLQQENDQAKTLLALRQVLTDWSGPPGRQIIKEWAQILKSYYDDLPTTFKNTYKIGWSVDDYIKEVKTVLQLLLQQFPGKHGEKLVDAAIEVGKKVKMDVEKLKNDSESSENKKKKTSNEKKKKSKTQQEVTFGEARCLKIYLAKLTVESYNILQGLTAENDFDGRELLLLLELTHSANEIAHLKVSQPVREVVMKTLPLIWSTASGKTVKRMFKDLPI